jgi:hypothetical protein
MTIDDSREYARQALAQIDVRYATPRPPTKCSALLTASPRQPHGCRAFSASPSFCVYLGACRISPRSGWTPRLKSFDLFAAKSGSHLGLCDRPKPAVAYPRLGFFDVAPSALDPERRSDKRKSFSARTRQAPHDRVRNLDVDARCSGSA